MSIRGIQRIKNFRYQYFTLTFYLTVIFVLSTIFNLTISAQENNATLCSDGLDNDGDGLIDCMDQECTSLINDGCQTCFNDGLSFADIVIEYSQPCSGNGFQDAQKALGVSDDAGVIGSINFVSLGNGGFIKLGFTNNILINSGTPAGDLHVFEIGPAVESMTIELKPLNTSVENILQSNGITDSDGDGYYLFGEVAGATSSLDIDGMIPGQMPGALLFDAVKLTDVPDTGCGSIAPGADLDAICALSSLPLEVCNNNLDDDGDGFIDCADDDLKDECCCLVQSVIDLGDDIITCLGDTIYLSIQQIFQNPTWSSGDTSHEISVVNSGSYSVTATDENDCPIVDNIEIQVLFDPIVKDTIMKCPEEIIVINHTEISEPGIYFDTSFAIHGFCDTIMEYTIFNHIINSEFLGENQVVCNNTHTLTSPWIHTIWSDGSSEQFFTITSSAWYTATAIDNNNCTISDSIFIDIQDVGHVYIPNAFSPNNDGINDIFRPYFESNKNPIYSMQIFTRWGEKIFDQLGNNVIWNGKVKNKKVPIGNYIYRIIISQGSCDNNQSLTGDVLLLE